MKKITYLLLAFSALLASCNFSETYIPEHGGSVLPSTSTSGGSTSTSVEPSTEEEKNTTIEFYLNYTYSETPLFSIEWYMLKPLGSIPSEVDSKEKILALAEEKIAGFTGVDPAFPSFKGFSFYGCCLSDSDLWDFTKDYKQQAVTCLYGIWVSE